MMWRETSTVRIQAKQSSGQASHGWVRLVQVSSLSFPSLSSQPESAEKTLGLRGPCAHTPLPAGLLPKPAGAACRLYFYLSRKQAHSNRRGEGTPPGTVLLFQVHPEGGGLLCFRIRSQLVWQRFSGIRLSYYKADSSIQPLKTKF